MNQVPDLTISGFTRYQLYVKLAKLRSTSDFAPVVQKKTQTNFWIDDSEALTTTSVELRVKTGGNQVSQKSW